MSLKEEARIVHKRPIKPISLKQRIFTQAIKQHAVEYRRLLMRPDRDRLLACPKPKEGVSPLC